MELRIESKLILELVEEQDIVGFKNVLIKLNHRESKIGFGKILTPSERELINKLATIFSGVNTVEETTDLNLYKD